MDNKITEIIKQIGNNALAEIKDETNLTDELGYDSIKYLMLITELERSFQIEFPEELILPDNFVSLFNIKRTIENVIHRQ